MRFRPKLRTSARSLKGRRRSAVIVGATHQLSALTADRYGADHSASLLRWGRMEPAQWSRGLANPLAYREHRICRPLDEEGHRRGVN